MITSMGEHDETLTRMPVVLPLPWDRPPLSLNDRPNRWAKARLTKQIRETVAWLARHREPITWPVDAVLVWTVTDSRQRDADNPVLTIKAAVDGCRDAGLLARDDTVLVRRSYTDIVRGSARRMRLEFRAVES